MAKLDDCIFLTARQIRELHEGRKVRFLRDGKWMTLGMKDKHHKVTQLKRKISKLKEQIKVEQSKGKKRQDANHKNKT